MGTNYYARLIPTQEKKKELCQLITNSNDFYHIQNVISEVYGPYTLSEGKFYGGIIHLGKYSGGWKFLWNPNIFIQKNGHVDKVEVETNHYVYNYIADPETYHYVYPLTKKGIFDFINQDNIKIFDEYGKEYSAETFFNEAVDSVKWRDGEAFDAKSYHLYEESKGHKLSIYKNTEYIKALCNLGFKVEWPYSDFYSDGLRFAVTNEFS